MTDPDLQLPATFLRADFPGEVGFVDHVRQPLSLEAAADYCRKVLKRAFSFSAAAEINSERRQYRPPRFFVYLVAIPPKSKDYQYWIHDGTTWLRVEGEGLFGDMLCRATVAQGKKPGTLTPIYPLAPAQPAEQWTLAPLAVLHDTERSVATVMPHARALLCLKANHQSA